MNPVPIPQLSYCLGREPSHVSAPVSTDVKRCHIVDCVRALNVFDVSWI